LLLDVVVFTSGCNLRKAFTVRILHSLNHLGSLPAMYFNSMKGRKNILVVDDEPLCVRPLGMMLKQAGYDVYTETCGLAALDLVLARHKDGQVPDLILCDVCMPDYDGLAFMRDLNAHGISVSVVVTTGCIDDETIEDLAAHGCVHILQKPFTKEKILEQVGSLIGPASGREQAGAVCHAYASRYASWFNKELYEQLVTGTEGACRKGG